MKTIFEADASGHDWWHIARVIHNAEMIQAEEGGDLELIRLAALLHDVGDHKFHKETDAPQKLITQMLQEENVNHEQRQLSFRVHPNPTTGNIILTVEEGIQLSEEARYEVSDLAGRKIADIKVMPSTTTYTFEINTNGIYIITLRDGSEIKDVQRVILSNN